MSKRIADIFSHYEPDPFGGCWLWLGSLNKCGYGQINRLAFGNTPQNAMRVFYRHLVGPIPTGMHILHKCDVKPCVNPAHLYAGTVNQNMQDMWDRIRGPRKVLKAKCKRGHPYDANNSRGHRICKTCARAASRRWEERRRVIRCA